MVVAERHGVTRKMTVTRTMESWSYFPHAMRMPSGPLRQDWGESGFRDLVLPPPHSQKWTLALCNCWRDRAYSPFIPFSIHPGLSGAAAFLQAPSRGPDSVAVAALDRSRGWRRAWAAACRRQDQGRRRTELARLAGPVCCLLLSGGGARGHVQDPCGNWDEDKEGDGDRACRGADCIALMSASVRGISGSALGRTPLCFVTLAPVRYWPF